MIEQSAVFFFAQKFNETKATFALSFVKIALRMETLNTWLKVNITHKNILKVIIIV